jgi:hypothetical protein
MSGSGILLSPSRIEMRSREDSGMYIPPTINTTRRGFGFLTVGSSPVTGLFSFVLIMIVLEGNGSKPSPVLTKAVFSVVCGIPSIVRRGGKSSSGRMRKCGWVDPTVGSWSNDCELSERAKTANGAMHAHAKTAVNSFNVALLL